MKKYLYILLTAMIIAGLFFTGCNYVKKQVPQSGIRNYSVAVSGTFPPFGMVGINGEAEGFEIDLLNAIAEAEGIKFNYLVTSWAGMMPALKSGQADFLMCSMTITEERKKEVDFTDAYFESTNYILVPEDSPIKGLHDLKGKTVSVLQASTSDYAVSGLLGKNYDGIKRFKQTTAAFLELRNRKVDAAIGDSGIVMYYVKINPENHFRVIKDSQFPKELYGMAVRKGDVKLLEILNSGLKKIKENGTYDAIYQKWFKF